MKKPSLADAPLGVWVFLDGKQGGPFVTPYAGIDVVLNFFGRCNTDLDTRPEPRKRTARARMTSVDERDKGDTERGVVLCQWALLQSGTIVALDTRTKTWMAAYELHTASTYRTIHG